MPTRIPVVIDTVRVIVRDTIAVRDTIVRLQASTAPSWIVPTITATASLTAALLAQWCAVLFSRWERRKQVIARLVTDLEAMRRLLKEMAASHTQEKGVHASVLAQIDLLCGSYAAHERDIVHVPHASDLEGMMSQVPNLRTLCKDAEAAVRVEYDRHLWWFFLRMRWRATRGLELRSHVKMTRDIDGMRALVEKEDAER
jgi:hypothetical protein